MSHFTEPYCDSWLEPLCWVPPLLTGPHLSRMTANVRKRILVVYLYPQGKVFPLAQTLPLLPRQQVVSTANMQNHLGTVFVPTEKNIQTFMQTFYFSVEFLCCYKTNTQI